MTFGLLGGLAVFLVLAVLLLVAAGVAFAMALAKRSKADYDAGNVTVPGRSGAVPESWGGSHDPEAVLHRRLVTAMAALRANQTFDDDGGLLDLRVSLEQQALDLDQRLLAVAALPPAQKSAPLGHAEEAVTSIEQAVTDMATRTSTDATASLQAALDQAKERIALIGMAQAELDAPTSTAPAPPVAGAPDSPSQATGTPPSSAAPGPG